MILKFGLILEQSLQFLRQHYVALDLQFARHVGLLSIQLAGYLESKNI